MMLLENCCDYRPVRFSNALFSKMMEPSFGKLVARMSLFIFPLSINHCGRGDLVQDSVPKSLSPAIQPTVGLAIADVHNDFQLTFFDLCFLSPIC